MVKIHFLIHWTEETEQEYLIGDQLLPSDTPTEINVRVDGYLCSLFFAVLQDHDNVQLFTQCLKQVYGKCSYRIHVTLVQPNYELIDSKGNEICQQLALERRELDHAMAWFSTLGGAFSALGDYMENCAVIAGKISTQQFQLAVRLGDPLLLSRCRLYMALSLIQQKKFSLAKAIIRRENEFAKRHILIDPKLHAMSLGIWAKWKYDKAKTRSIINGNISSLT